MSDPLSSGSPSQFWLDAWYDPTLGLHSFSSGMCLDDGKLYVGDLSGVLKVFSNGKVIKTVKLNGVPSAVCGFENELTGNKSIAVACGPSVYIFKSKDMMPYHKFTIDPAKISPIESEIWEKLKSGEINPTVVCSRLREQGNLSQRSLNILALENDPERLERYINEEVDYCKKPIHSCITCMEVLKKEESSAVGSLVLGLESKKILFLDLQCRRITKSISIRGAPVFIAITGTSSVEYRIVVACRDKRIYSIKNGDLIRSSIELESPVCGGLVRCGRDIIVGCMDKTIHSFHTKGKKNWTMYMESHVTNIAVFECERLSNNGFLVALKSGEIRLYIDKTLMSTIPCPGNVVTGFEFGSFNREANTLVVLFTSGALDVKMLKRTAKLDPSKAPVPGPPPEQDIPLDIPKKTKLYVDQTQRERDHALEMHQSFQRSLCKVRYVAAKSYVKLFQNSGVANSQLYTSSNHSIDDENDTKERITMSVEVHGLGPQFKLSLQVENIGSLPIIGTSASVLFEKESYHLENPVVQLPVLIPQLLQTFEVSLHGLIPGAAAPPLQVSIVRKGVILVTAIVEMPVVEIL